MEDSGGTIKVAGVGTYVSATDDITRNDTWNWNGTVIDDSPTTNITLSGGTHTVRCGAIDDSLNGTVRDEPPSGRYRTPDNVMYGNPDGAPGGEFSESAGQIILTSMTLNDPTWINEIAANVTTAAAGGNVRFGIYPANPDGTPGSLIVDSGDLATDSTGFVSNSLTNPIFLPQGTYLVGNQGDNTTVTCRGFSGDASGDNVFGSIQGVNDGSHAESMPFFNGTYGTMPTTLGTPDGTQTNAILGLYYR